jgi:hypothetical protein
MTAVLTEVDIDGLSIIEATTAAASSTSKCRNRLGLGCSSCSFLNYEL